jgi:citrate lyase beta subunit
VSFYTAEELLPYQVGALLYIPAIQENAAEKICSGVFPCVDSVALCLEDAITHQGVERAEEQLCLTLSRVSAQSAATPLPLIFIRVRDCRQAAKITKLLGEATSVLMGFIFPKFDLSNAEEYCEFIQTVNQRRDSPLYFMPILESEEIMSLASRERSLLGVKALLDACGRVLNVRVGVMDFCRLYGLRKTVKQTIYDIGVVRNVLADVLTVFAGDYVVSAPVWEYFHSPDGGDEWARGLEKELELDFANGFVGKTAIHPSQLELIHRFLKPLRADYADARSILDWGGGDLGVAKSFKGDRMNEVSVHNRWARKILMLAEIYGVSG